MFACNTVNPSRWVLTAIWIMLGSASNCVLAQETAGRSPHNSDQQTSIRYVSSSQAELFAGPGDEFYPTAILQSGQSIEVHHESADGWLAISPPAGSFSWLPASHGLLLPGGRVVEVTEKSAVSWIGTTLGTAKQYRWQVKLARGQQLAVIGEQTIDDPTTGSKALWYKIAPPSGEYRWIQAKATSTQPPTSNKLADAPESSADSVAGVTNPSLDANLDGQDSQVVPASAEQTQASNRKTPRSTSRRGPQQHSVDRWDDWHAVEFKNGSFSFPGMARMLGIQPAQPTKARAPEDPFDLTAAYARGQPNQANLPHSVSGAHSNEDLEGDNSEPVTSSMAVRQSRGWRDPRQLRQDRIRSRSGTDALDESALVADDSSYEDTEVMDASFEESYEVGTSVVTAGATEARGTEGRRTRRANSHSNQTGGAQPSDQAWYGIEQAPASQVAGLANRTNAAALSSLEEVQLELSTMVAGPEQTWNLAPLAERARYFIEHGEDSLQRGQARLLLERIESFAHIARQSIAAPQLAAQTSNSLQSRPGTTLSASPASWVAPQSNQAIGTGPANTGSKFDATGWLVPVHSSGRDMPTHALTNDAGRIIVYVTPAPGVNLIRYESQAIGVYGLRGYLPQLKTNHIQIQRAVRLQ